MLETVSKNLTTGIVLIQSVSDAQYRDAGVAPYHASIGSHIRHILDVFDCVFCGLESGEINLVARTRNLQVEQNRAAGLVYLQQILAKLEGLQTPDMERLVHVTDDLGDGEVTYPYTLAAAIIQAHSHAIHHFAAIGYLLCQLGIGAPNVDFGYNPTTPRKCKAI